MSSALETAIAQRNVTSCSSCCRIPWGSALRYGAYSPAVTTCEELIAICRRLVERVGGSAKWP
jgi:hypothetical protein